MSNLKVSKAVLVYQAGIANVFKVDRFSLGCRDRFGLRLMQADFRSCEMFAHGLGVAGAVVLTASCNQAGDIINAEWVEGLDDCPFRDNARPVVRNAGLTTFAECAV